MFRTRFMQGATLFALLAPSLFGSCAADSVSLSVKCALLAEAPDCEYSESSACSLGGTLNLAAKSSYDAVLRVTNGLKPRARDVPPQSEPNGVFVYELEVEVKDSANRKPNLGNLPNPFTVPATGFAEPSEDAVVGAELLPPVYVARILANEGTPRALGSARLSITARGRTAGRVEVESQPWTWTVRLYSLSLDAADGVCVKKDDEVCGIGQDNEAATCFQTGDDST